MKVRLLMVLLALGFMAQAQTVFVEGKQSGVWDADTVVVTGDVKIEDTLLISPGVTVLFDGFYTIQVLEGTSFRAEGTDTEPIVFTVADTTGFSVFNQGCGGWNGFLLNKAERVRFDHCLLQYAKAADTLDRFGGALNVLDCHDVELRHTTLRCNFSREHGGALNAENSTLCFSHCAVNENLLYTSDPTYAMYGAGLRFLKCDVAMSDMEFRGNYGPTSIGGGMSLDSCSVVLDRAVFTDNIAINGGGFYIMRCNDKECRFSNLLVVNNHSRHFAGGFAFADASPDVYNATVYGNSSEGVNCNGVFFYQYSSPKMNNCIIYGNYPDSLSAIGDTIQMWLWTFDDYAPEFRNCLIENGMDAITGDEYIHVFEDIIDADPCFVDPETLNFRLRAESPCRDAGLVTLPDFLLNGTDLDGMPRVANQRIDLGPYEYSANDVSQQAARSSASLIGNPLNAQSRLEFRLTEAGPVSLHVYDLTGRRVVSKELGRKTVGNHTFDLGFMTEDPKAGLYLIELVTPERTVTFKAIR